MGNSKEKCAGFSISKLTLFRFFLACMCSLFIGPIVSLGFVLLTSHLCGIDVPAAVQPSMPMSNLNGTSIRSTLWRVAPHVRPMIISWPLPPPQGFYCLFRTSRISSSLRAPNRRKTTVRYEYNWKCEWVMIGGSLVLHLEEAARIFTQHTIQSISKIRYAAPVGANVSSNT